MFVRQAGLAERATRRKRLALRFAHAPFAPDARFRALPRNDE
jgi:hypothetical protein